MNHTFQPLTPETFDGFFSLIEALADYEKLPRPTAEARERMRRHVTDSPPKFEGRVATDDRGRVVGYAVFFHTYSTFLALPTLYLEDLFVLPEARGHGVGGELFRRVAALAVARGCGRMEWSVLDWNQLALDFYARRAAKQMKEWVWHRLEGDALKAAAEHDGSWVKT